MRAFAVLLVVCLAIGAQAASLDTIDKLERRLVDLLEARGGHSGGGRGPQCEEASDAVDTNTLTIPKGCQGDTCTTCTCGTDAEGEYEWLQDDGTECPKPEKPECEEAEDSGNTIDVPKGCVGDACTTCTCEDDGNGVYKWFDGDTECTRPEKPECEDAEDDGNTIDVPKGCVGDACTTCTCGDDGNGEYKWFDGDTECTKPEKPECEDAEDDGNTIDVPKGCVGDACTTCTCGDDGNGVYKWFDGDTECTKPERHGDKKKGITRIERLQQEMKRNHGDAAGTKKGIARIERLLEALARDDESSDDESESSDDESESSDDESESSDDESESSDDESESSDSGADKRALQLERELLQVLLKQARPPKCNEDNPDVALPPGCDREVENDCDCVCAVDENGDYRWTEEGDSCPPPPPDRCLVGRVEGDATLIYFPKPPPAEEDSGGISERDDGDKKGRDREDILKDLLHLLVKGAKACTDAAVEICVDDCNGAEVCPNPLVLKISDDAIEAGITLCEKPADVR